MIQPGLVVGTPAGTGVLLVIAVLAAVLILAAFLVQLVGLAAPPTRGGGGKS